MCASGRCAPWRDIALFLVCVLRFASLIVVLMMLSFYAGETPFEFVMLRSPYMTGRQLQNIGRKTPRPAMVCINDDFKFSNHFFDEAIASATKTLKSWMASTWSTKTWWER